METPSYLRNKAVEKYLKGVFSFRFCSSLARESFPSLYTEKKVFTLYLKKKKKMKAFKKGKSKLTHTCSFASHHP